MGNTSILGALGRSRRSYEWRIRGWIWRRRRGIRWRTQGDHQGEENQQHAKWGQAREHRHGRAQERIRALCGEREVNPHSEGQSWEESFTKHEEGKSYWWIDSCSSNWGPSSQREYSDDEWILQLLRWATKPHNQLNRRTQAQDLERRKILRPRKQREAGNSSWWSSPQHLRESSK